MDNEKMLRFLQNEHVLPKLRADFYQRELKQRDLDYGPNDLCIMRRVCRSEGMSQAQLASEVACPAPTVTRKLKKLIARGLIDKREDSTDYRKNCLYLTDEGREAAKTIYEICNQSMDFFFEGFTEEEQELCVSFLERMRQNAEKALSE
ncbi:MAG: MarR family transcriptional regulator [Clostridia bacterium]|nr:MarR family transcriptional regulator [Clostridia bacterium]